ncbi:MAG: SH3 domain-containing protein [Pseudomonadota bacterium]
MNRTINIIAFACLAWVLVPPAAHAGLFEREQPTVIVVEQFIEMHTGPGRGYPVFYVAAEGERLVLLKRRTDWFKVRLNRGDYIEKEGWIRSAAIDGTIDERGEPVEFYSAGIGDFATRRFELGFGGGAFDGARTLEGYAAWAMTPNISLRLNATQILGSFSEGIMGTANVVMVPFPQWRVSPFFSIGTGIIHTEPQTTVVQAEDRTDEIASAGLGANIYLTRRFVLNLEYRRHTLFTSRDDNEEVDQWKAGFSFFLGRR